MRWVASVGLALFVAVSAFGQEVRLPGEIYGSVGAWIIVAPEVVTGGKAKWRIDPGLQEVRLDLLFPPEVATQARGKVLTSTVSGRFRVEAWNALGDVPSDIATSWLVIGTPAPPGPVPPTPPVPPVPPVPPNPPAPAPIPAAGFRVVILHETAAAIPEAQEQVLNSPEIISYLVQHAAKDPNGAPSFRIWDDDYTEAQLINTPPYLKTAYLTAQKARPDNVPWIVVSDGTNGESRELPGKGKPYAEALADTLTLLKKYGGN